MGQITIANRSFEAPILVPSVSSFETFLRPDAALRLQTVLWVHWAPGIPHALFGRNSSRTARAHRAARMRRCVCKQNLQLSSPAQAGDPVFRDVSDGIEKPRRTGYPACAGYDGSLWSSFVDGQSEACPPSHATWWARRKRLCPPYNQASSSAKADDPVFRGVSDETARPRRTGYSAFAEYDGEWCGCAVRLPSNSTSSRFRSPHPETRRPRG
jgi:hypothetical protein